MKNGIWIIALIVLVSFSGLGFIVYQANGCNKTGGYLIDNEGCVTKAYYDKVLVTCRGQDVCSI